jgi:hypothetical protein
MTTDAGGRFSKSDTAEFGLCFLDGSIQEVYIIVQVDTILNGPVRRCVARSKVARVVDYSWTTGGNQKIC